MAVFFAPQAVQRSRFSMPGIGVERGSGICAPGQFGAMAAAAPCRSTLLTLVWRRVSKIPQFHRSHEW